MPHSHTYEAIVLKTYDVGEADRFCVLLTRERGRLAVRARAVRKLNSRMGSSILPLRHISVDLHEGKAGILVTGVKPLQTETRSQDIGYFFLVQQGVDLLLGLLHDEEPASDLFDTTLELLAAETPDPNARHPILPFTIRVLSLLGLLPATPEGKLAAALTEPECTFLQACTSSEWHMTTSQMPESCQRLQKLCRQIVEQQTSRPLRAEYSAWLGDSQRSSVTNHSAPAASPAAPSRL